MSEYPLGHVCEHGTLARKCDLCFYQKENAQLREAARLLGSEVRYWRVMTRDLFKQRDLDAVAAYRNAVEAASNVDANHIARAAAEGL
jgi:hypothetical protein